MISLLVHKIIYVVIFLLFNCIEQYTATRIFLTNQNVFYVVFIFPLHERLHFAIISSTMTTVLNLSPFVALTNIPHNISSVAHRYTPRCRPWICGGIPPV